MNLFEKICKENDLIVKSFRMGDDDKLGGFYRTSFDMKKTSLIWSIPISNYENIYGIIYPDKERLKVLTNITYAGGKRLLVQGHWNYINYEDQNIIEYIRTAKNHINKYKLYYDLAKQEEKMKEIEKDFE